MISIASGLLAVCLALCAPVPADANVQTSLPPPELLEFLGEFGNDDGGLIDPTRLPAPGKLAQSPVHAPAPTTDGAADDARR